MSLLDTIQGVIARRVLLNYRIDPTALQQVLPAPFRPKLYRGYGIGGICMIRFKELRPRLLPAWLGMGSENAAHRIAVEWDEEGERKEGVYIPRRDTDSWLNQTLGGHAFPGIFTQSAFEVHEEAEAVAVRIVRPDGGEEIAFSGHVVEKLPETSLFESIEDASQFFLSGSTGYSATPQEGHYHGIDLECLNWNMMPMEIEVARSCFFGDTNRFPPGSVELDCALLMRDIDHKWHSRPDLHLSQNQKSFAHTG